ncbi:hypothetical protein D3C83_190100 [compost metagenome]
MSIPKSTTLTITCRTVLMIVGPPGLPTANHGLPFLRTIVGVIDESGRFRGSIEFASP